MAETKYYAHYSDHGGTTLTNLMGTSSDAEAVSQAQQRFGEFLIRVMRKDGPNTEVIHGELLPSEV